MLSLACILGVAARMKDVTTTDEAAMAAGEVGMRDAPDQRVTYRVSWQFDWTRHPGTPRQPGNAHFTDPVLATHSQPGNAFWQAGIRASGGVRDLCEFGATDRVAREIRCSKRCRRSCSNPIVFPDGTDGPSQTLNMTIVVDHRRPFITGLSMIAPSPDWCVGASGRSLLKGNGMWEEELTLDLVPYDAGTRRAERLELFGPKEKDKSKRMVGPVTQDVYQRFFASQPLGRLVLELQGPAPEDAQEFTPWKQRRKSCRRKR